MLSIKNSYHICCVYFVLLCTWYLQVTAIASEGPKLTHPTASRPKPRGRRPPKRYAVFHEDDSKDDVSYSNKFKVLNEYINLLTLIGANGISRVAAPPTISCPIFTDARQSNGPTHRTFLL